MKKYYHVIVDGRPLEIGGKPAIYTRGEAIKKAHAWNGKIKEVDEETAANEEMKEALFSLKNAFLGVLQASDYETEFDSLKYPFDCNFKEMVNKVIDWVDYEMN